MFYLLKNEKKVLSRPCQGQALFTLALTSIVFFNHQGQNRITIQPNRFFFHHFETIIYDTV